MGQGECIASLLPTLSGGEVWGAHLYSLSSKVGYLALALLEVLACLSHLERFRLPDGHLGHGTVRGLVYVGCVGLKKGQIPCTNTA